MEAEESFEKLRLGFQANLTEWEYIESPRTDRFNLTRHVHEGVVMFWNAFGFGRDRVERIKFRLAGGMVRMTETSRTDGSIKVSIRGPDLALVEARLRGFI